MTRCKCHAEKVVEPLQSRHKLVYYHRHYRRVPTIDECEVDDQVCFYEANQQFRRDRCVSDSLTEMLRWCFVLEVSFYTFLLHWCDTFG